MNKIESQEQYRDLIQQDKLTVIKYEADWCPDCKNLDRFIGTIIEDNPDKQFFSLDVEQLPDIAEQNGVRGIPSLLVYQNGEKLAHLHSKYAKTPAQVSEYLRTLESQV